MKTPPTQFDVRENTASQRQHDSRPATEVRPDLIRMEQQALKTRTSQAENVLQATGSETELHVAPQRATTGGRDGTQFLTVREVADILQVPVSWIYGRMRKRSAERLPGYRLGKYWRFQEQEVLEWVRCHRGSSRGT
jgi:excisionase family DNA binding protein